MKKLYKKWNKRCVWSLDSNKGKLEQNNWNCSEFGGAKI